VCVCVCVCVCVWGTGGGASHMLGVLHADAVLHDQLAALDLLHDAHQLPRVLGHFVREGADAVGHVQDGGADLIRFVLEDRVLRKKRRRNDWKIT